MILSSLPFEYNGDVNGISKGSLFALFLLLGALTLWYIVENSFGKDVVAHAETFVSLCEVAEDRSGCYEREVPKLLSEMSLPDVFEVIREIRKLDTNYQFCHVLAHKLGERVVAEDPERWIDAISLNPQDSLCSNGFIHGVIGGRFRAEVLDDETLEKLLPDFSRACEPHSRWSPTALDQAICYHGMGHVFMFITDARIKKALSLCERTASSGLRDFRQVCREGVFMQIYQPLEPDDFLLIERMPEKPTKETVRAFCAKLGLSNEERGACLRESWPFFKDEVLNGSDVESFCSGQPDESEEAACYRLAASIIGRLTLERPDRILEACAAFPEARKPLCYSYTSRVFIEEDRMEGPRAIAFCESAPEPYRDGCIGSLVETTEYNFGSDSSGRHTFCAAVPERWKTRCLSFK